jgi:uncharacterized membrane protein
MNVSWMDFRKHWKTLIALSVTGLWGVSLFISPFVAPTDTIHELDGRSNRVDNEEAHASLPGYSRAVYTIGDVLCHQKEDRSLMLNGNQMPLCSRCVSIFTFMIVGLVLALLIPQGLNSREYVLHLMPKRFSEELMGRFGKEVSAIIIIALFMSLVAIDGMLQILTPYESTNILRILTGVPTGVICGILIGSICNTRRTRSDIVGLGSSTLDARDTGT